MKIPKEVKQVIDRLEGSDYEAYIVGGCVRDTLLKKQPSDWDVATNAKPQETAKLFPNIFEVEEYGLVTVLTGSKEPSLKEVEIMPYRSESGYSDKRHPDNVEWVESIEEDLSRRDFTVNAMALKISKRSPKAEVIDLFNGREDLESRTIRAVGRPDERFLEDALRILRAVRFATVLGEEWTIEDETLKSIQRNAELLSNVSQERIRDELVKMIMSPHALKGINLLKDTGLLSIILPELQENVGVVQNKHHTYDCYEHAVLSLDYAVKQKYSPEVRLASLLHDIAKPRVKEGEGEEATFYNHEIVGAKMTKKILQRLRFPNEIIRKVTLLVRYHLFYYNVDEVTESSVRKLVKNVGLENIDELLQVRYADRIGSGVPKAIPYKLRHLQYLIEKVSKDPISVSMLKVSGEDVMKLLDSQPGPKVGQVLDVLFSEVLDDPKKNKKKDLEKRADELSQLSDDDLRDLATQSKKSISEVVNKDDKMLKDKYWVK